MALTTSTTVVNGYTITHHVSRVASPRGLVVYFDGDGQAKVTPPISGDLAAMAAAANAAGFNFAAPRSPLSNIQWWDTDPSEHAGVARAYVDQQATAMAAKTAHLVGYSGGATLICKNLAKEGTWPSKYTGGSLLIGGGSTTNTISTPVSWRAGWPMRFVVGDLDVVGATVPAWWSAFDYSAAAEAEFREAGHPTLREVRPGKDHKNYDFGGEVAAYLAAVAPTPTAQEPSDALTVLESTHPDKGLTPPGLGTIENGQWVIDAATAERTPLWVAAALVFAETRGLNIYGHDADSEDGTVAVFSTRHRPVTINGVTYPQGSNIPVTRANYEVYLSRVYDSNRNVRPGVKPNGVGPLQLTWWTIPRDTEKAGIDISDPVQNIRYGLRLLNGFTAGDWSELSVKEAGTRYNAGNLSGGINYYGEALWRRSEVYRRALEGSTVSPTPGGSAPGTGTDPVLVEPVMVSDPGPHAELMSMAAYTVLPLPDPPAGPVRETGGIPAPRRRARFRGQWWTVQADPEESKLAWSMSIPGPDQSSVGASMVAAAGSVTLAKPRTVTKTGWAAWARNPPSPGEDVWVEDTVDDGETWVRRFTGVVDGTDFALDDSSVTLRVIERTSDFNIDISHPPLNFRQPAPGDGAQYMRIGLHTAYFTNLVARAAGYYCTPPMDAATTIVSAPMVGSLWPERGTIISARTFDAKGSTEGVSSDAPDYVRTWWGLTERNFFARYRPSFPAGVGGRLTRPMGVRCLVGPTSDMPAWVELFWSEDSIMIQVVGDRIIIETQDAWLPGGLRHVVHSRTRTLTAQQQKDGFQLTVWFSPDGTIVVDVDGHRTTHTPIPAWLDEMVSQNLEEVRVTSRPAGAVIGGLMVVSSSKWAVLGDWERRFHLDVDTDRMIWGSPALVKVNGLDLLKEQAEAELSACYLDEYGHLHSVSRNRMDSRPSVRTLRRRDVVSPPGQITRGSLASSVDVTWKQPSLNQSRLNSRFSMQVWEGPKDTIDPGDFWEEIVTVPDGEDWFHVDGTFLDISTATVAKANTGVGSMVGGTTIQEAADGTQEEGAAPQSWFWMEAERIAYDSFRVSGQYTPPAGVTARLEWAVPDLPGLNKRRVGTGPILRARGKQTWADHALPAPKATGVGRRVADELVHDGSWWVQSIYVANRIGDRYAQMLAKPIPTWGPVELAEPDLRIRRGDTVTLDIDGVSRPARVVDLRESFDAGGLHQVLTLRQLRP